MKRKKKIIIAIILLIIVVAAVTTYFVLKSRNVNSRTDSRSGIEKPNMEGIDLENTEELKNNSNNVKQNITKTTTLTSSSEVKSALTENVELHATYYFKEVYVEENELIKEGTKILKYTNGTYLTAPYDCYIIGLNIPDEGEKCLNSHYIQISSSNMLLVGMNIDEENINNVKVGIEVTIEVSAINKTYTGYVTHVDNIGNNGRFGIEIEFENDGNVRLGMSANIELDI